MRKTGTLIATICICIIFIAFSDAGYASDTSDPVSMPEVIILDSISDIYEPVEFDHMTHADDIADSCIICHHQHPVGFAQSCNECHKIEPSVFRKSVVNKFLPCQDCHEEIDPGNPDVPGLKAAYHRACFKCHRTIGNVGLDPKGCTQICHDKK